MKNKTYRFLITLLILCLTACSANFTATGSSTKEIQNTDTIAQTASEVPAADAGTNAIETTGTDHAPVHEDPDDYTWDSAAEIPISLKGESITSGDTGVSVDGSRATITAAGTYNLSGELSDGQIVVDTEDGDIVRIVLDNVSIHNSSGPAILIQNAEKAMIVLADDSQNELSDGSSYTLEADSDEPNAAIFSKTDLTIYGSGSLTVEANYKDGIASKDGLLINSGTINVTTVGDGLRGKDYVVIKGGNLSITGQLSGYAGGDGIKSDEDEEIGKGYITIEAGQFHIESAGDAIAAESDLTILDGTFDLTSGSGITGQLPDYEVDEATSAKGLKGTNSITISGGHFTINAADDGLHSNNSITVNGGTFQIESADDGIHADMALTINGGQIDITGSYEGLESAVITINEGEIRIIASDDGINASGGTSDASMGQGDMGRMMPGGQRPGLPADTIPEERDNVPIEREMTAETVTDGTESVSNDIAVIPNKMGSGMDGPGGNGGAMGAGGGMFEANDDYQITINGGSIYMDAGGDGIDSNGSIEMTGGLILVNGPTNSGNGALDYAGTFNILGGVLIAAGSAGMAQAPSDSSSQNAVLVNFDSVLTAGTLIHVQDSVGKTIFTFAPDKDFQSVVFSTPELITGDSYSILIGGISDGDETYGLFNTESTSGDESSEEDQYSDGTEYGSFTISGIITQIGSGSGGMFRR